MPTPLPATLDFTGASVTEDGFKAALTDLRAYLAGLLGTDGVAATARAALGVAAAFPTGTRMLFQQTSAPTGWTKDTSATYHDSALRIVTGAVSTGGADAFTATFGTSKSTAGHAITVAQMPSHAHGVTDAGHTHGVSDPGHVHTLERVFASGGIASGVVVNAAGASAGTSSEFVGSAGTGVTISSGNAGIAIQNAGSGQVHSHTLSNMNLKFTDCIVASKD